MPKKTPKIFALVLALIMALLMFEACGDSGVAERSGVEATYSVTFLDWDGTVLATRTGIASGGSAAAPSDPERDGYAFTGWSGTYTNVTANQTVTATYKAVSVNPQFVVSSASASQGESDVAVTVSIRNNPGIASAKLAVAFDGDLTLTDVVYNMSGLGGQSLSPQRLTSPVTLNWFNGSADTKGDMVYATLRFKVAKDAAAGAHPITVTYNPNDVYNIGETNVTFDIINGEITVS